MFIHSCLKGSAHNLNNVVEIKSKKFAVKIINLYKMLKETKNETVMSKQILRCGTSIGANIAEAVCSVSKKDFLAKMYIAFKETAETKYWLDLLKETYYIDENEYDSLSKDCIELKKLLSSITKTTKETI